MIVLIIERGIIGYALGTVSFCVVLLLLVLAGPARVQTGESIAPLGVGTGAAWASSALLPDTDRQAGQSGAGASQPEPATHVVVRLRR